MCSLSDMPDDAFLHFTVNNIAAIRTSGSQFFLYIRLWASQCRRFSCYCNCTKYKACKRTTQYIAAAHAAMQKIIYQTGFRRKLTNEYVTHMPTSARCCCVVQIDKIRQREVVHRNARCKIDTIGCHCTVSCRSACRAVLPLRLNPLPASDILPLALP